jgi:hypothetical protein
MAKPDQRLTSSDWSVILHMTRELRTIEAAFWPNHPSIDRRKVVVLCGVKRLHRPLNIRNLVNSSQIVIIYMYFIFFIFREVGVVVGYVQSSLP